MNLGTFTLLTNATDRIGRIYNREELEKSVVGKTFTGELVPLDGPETKLNLSNVSHTVNNIRFEGNDLVGEITAMPTPAGMILKSLFEEGIRLVTSIRAVGNVSKDMIVSDLEVFTFDFLMEMIGKDDIQ
jgi:hypothetical protein